MKYFFALLLLLSQFSLAAETEPTFSFISMPVNQAANLIFNDALKVPYILSPDVVKDDRAVSFRSPQK